MSQASDYQAFTKTTAVYPQADAQEYLALAICDEVGEVIEKLAPYAGYPSEGLPKTLSESVLAECGDVMYYVARKADELDFPLQDIMNRANYAGPATIPAVLMYMAIHAGRIAGRDKKRIRDGAEWSDEQRTNAEGIILFELQGIVGCIKVLVRFFGMHIEGVMFHNQKKLEGRRDRGTIKGEGDNR